MKLKEICIITGKWLLSQTLRFFYSLLLAAMIGSVTWKTSRDYIWNEYRTVFETPPLQWKVESIIVVLIAILVVEVIVTVLGTLLFVKLRKKSTEGEYFFIDYAGFSWKTWVILRHTEDTPYCMKCKVQLTRDTQRALFCSNCKFSRNANMFWLRTQHDAASNLANAKIDGHIP